jgi:rare lipoprotein A (peptidoglycan hydrolase)
MIQSEPKKVDSNYSVSPLGAAVVVLMLAMLTGCAGAGQLSGKDGSSRSRAIGKAQYGKASWHAPTSRSERRTASGRPWVGSEMIAAHRTWPLGSTVRVTNLKNNRQAVVKITDRGPYKHGRIIDLSACAARQIDMFNAGIGSVRVELLASSTPPSRKAGDDLFASGSLLVGEHTRAIP